MLATSTQTKFWTFPSKEHLTQRREQAWQKYAIELSGQFTEEEIPSFKEQKIILDYYGSVIIKLCNQFQPPSPPSVYASALMYFKRFYINTSPLEYHPQELVYLCIYLAAKVDEYNVSLGQFIQQLAPTYKNVADFVISNELLLMQKLHFHLTVHNAFRPMEGFLVDIKTRFGQLEDPEQYRPEAERFIVKALIADTFLLFAPSQIALASLRFSIGKTLDKYIIHVFGQNESTQKLFHKMEAINHIVNEFSLPDKEDLDAIKQKLSNCRNQEHNPLSEKYKAKEIMNKALKEEMKVKRYEQMMKEKIDDDENILI